MIGKILKILWKYIDIILILIAFTCIAYGAFLIGSVPGFFVLGALLLITAFLTELMPKKGSGN